MGSPYLNTNEDILLSTHNVIINTIPSEAILTTQRLVIVDSRHTRLLPQDIPFSAIETVTIGDTSAMEPELSLSIVMKDETRRPLGIIFPQPSKTRRAGERDEWAVKLKEVSSAAQKDHGLTPADLLPPWVPGPLPEESSAGSRESPDEPFRFAPLTVKTPIREPPKSRRPVIATVLAVIVILALVVGVYLFAPQFTGTGGTPAVHETTSATPEPTAANPTPAAPLTTGTPITTVITTSPDTPVPTATPTPQADVTQSGVWIRIMYDGPFAASYGTSGRIRETTASGDQYYKIPAKDQIIDAIVKKNDESGAVLTVFIYNNGQLAGQGTTASPHGTVELHVDLRKIATTTTTSAALPTSSPVGNATLSV